MSALAAIVSLELNLPCVERAGHAERVTIEAFGFDNSTILLSGEE